MKKIDYKKQQLHAGDCSAATFQKGIMRKLFHTTSDGNYRSGWVHERTPEQLYK